MTRTWIAADRIGTDLTARGMTANGTPVWTRSIAAEGGTIAALAKMIEGFHAETAGRPGAEVVLAGALLPPDTLGAVPCQPVDTLISWSENSGSTLRFRLVPGLKQATPNNVTCGAETVIAGVLARDPTFDGVVCHLGAQSCWAQVSAGEVVSFRTFITAEIAFAVLKARGLGAAYRFPQPGTPALDTALDDALSRPERLAARLGELDAERYLASLPDGELSARVWGQLIGAELAAAKPYWLGQIVAIVGDAGQAAVYAGALQGLGVTVTSTQADAMVQAGLVWAKGLPDR